MAGALRPGGSAPAADGGAPSDADVRAAAEALLAAGCPHVFVTRGARGALWARASGDGTRAAFDELPARAVHVASTRGAGDAFVAGAVWQLLNETAEGSGAGKAPVDDDATRRAVRAGMEAARLTLETDAAVSPDLSPVALTAAAGYG